MKLLEKINLKTSLSLSIIGILILLFLTTLSPRLTNIQEINKDFLERQVKVNGEIFEIRSFEETDFQVISIKDNSGKIDVTSDKILNLTLNQTIQVIGQVREYNNTLQIQAEKIILNK